MPAINVTINGDPREVPPGLTVEGLLEFLGIIPGRVAIECNLDILTRAHWKERYVQPGDTFEIVNFVGGG
ncbi:MAG: sulfur carrier protein ThiS [Candidatus Acidiferrales bacterium]